MYPGLLKVMNDKGNLPPCCKIRPFSLEKVSTVKTHISKPESLLTKLGGYGKPPQEIINFFG